MLILCLYFSSLRHFLISVSEAKKLISYPSSGCREQGCLVHTCPCLCQLPALPIFLILGTASKEILRFCSRWVSIEFHTVSKNLRKTHSFHLCNAASIPRPLLHQKEPAAAAAPAPLHELTDTSKAKDASHQVTQPQHFMGSLVYS